MDSIEEKGEVEFVGEETEIGYKEERRTHGR
jgi:hypothetical protein